MPRFRKCRCLRYISYLFAIAALGYLLLQHETRDLSIKESLRAKAEYASHPVYEYTSIYRTRADRIFEETLDQQVLSIERNGRNAIPHGNQSLVANLTIWQIASRKEAENWAAWNSQWWDANPQWSYQLYTSPPVDFLQIFKSIPDIISATKKHSSVRKDLLKYLLLWYYGGFYADINTWSKVAMFDCPPTLSVLEGKNAVSLMIGVDLDEPYLTPNTLKSWGWTRSFGFGTSVLWAPRRFDPILRRAIVRSISHARTQQTLDWGWRRYIQNSQSNSEVSGSGMLTDIIAELLSRNLAPEDPLRDRDAGLERRVTWKKFRALKSPVWIEDSNDDKLEDEIRGVAILPINIWASGQGHSGSGLAETEEACVYRVNDWESRQDWRDRIFD